MEIDWNEEVKKRYQWYINNGRQYISFLTKLIWIERIGNLDLTEMKKKVVEDGIGDFILGHTSSPMFKYSTDLPISEIIWIEKISGIDLASLKQELAEKLAKQSLKDVKSKSRIEKIQVILSRLELKYWVDLSEYK